MRHSRNGRIDAWQTPSELKAPGTDVREGESSIDGAYGFIRRVKRTHENVAPVGARSEPTENRPEAYRAW